VLQTLRRRLQGEREGGFTLIELMVVVLIIAILIAIDAQLYSSDVTATGPLKLGEPALTYVADGSMTAATAGNVYVSVPATNTVVLGTRSASGTCYYLKDITTGTGAGTFYFQDTTCGAPSATAASVTLARWTA
jgi:prepilin-type N-terminal cleavage/methylation domain-containing protein